MAESYRPSKATLYYGGGGFLVNLNPLIDAGYALVGVGNIARRPILGQRGRTADGVDAGINPTAALRYGAGIETIRSNPKGFVVLLRDDASDCFVVPSLFTGISTIAPAAGIITRAATFVQAEGNHTIATTVVRKKSSPTFTIPAGAATYIVKTFGTGAINLKRSGSNVASVAASKAAGVYPVTAASNSGYTFELQGNSTGFLATGIPNVAEGS